MVLNAYDVLLRHVNGGSVPIRVRSFEPGVSDLVGDVALALWEYRTGADLDVWRAEAVVYVGPLCCWPVMDFTLLGRGRKVAP